MIRSSALAAVFVSLLSCVPCRAVDWYVNALAAQPGNGQAPETAFQTIQEGIDAASDGDTVIVAEGTYFENIHFNGNNIILTSTDPLNSTVVENTIIDGQKSGSVVTFSGTEMEACVLSGFTIRNGLSGGGGGICGGSWYGHTHATIARNVIRGNAATPEAHAGSGGGILCCDGSIRNNVIAANSAKRAGGGLSSCNGLIHDNTVIGNSAVEDCGGGLAGCDGSIENNLISGNSCHIAGGGVFGCEGTIENNTIIGNRAGGSGGGLGTCGGTIRNNIIADNVAGCDYMGPGGGGLSGCDGTIQNNTIFGNTADQAGGVYRSGSIANCIVWGNRATYGEQIMESLPPSFSCIEDWSGGGEGNIAQDPQFVDPDSGDFRLRPDSPCIDAGFNDPDLPERDISGMPRVLFGGKSFTVDMGAFEYRINRVWRTTAGNLELEWSSLEGKSYPIFWSEDLVNWDILDIVPSRGNATTVFELPEPTQRRTFYRVNEE